MKLGLYSKLAWRNLKANKQLQVPFLLASSLMYATLYMMASLQTNQYVNERHGDLPMLMGLGTVIVSILVIIFTIYGQNFIAKRRSKEFSLYSILGFEKVHISFVILIEQIINFVMIGFLSIISGQLLGTLMFKILSNLLKDTASTLGDYPISLFAMGLVLLVLGGTLTLIYLVQTFRVSLLNPIDLLGQQKAGEQQSKFQWFWLLLGIASLAAGYYIAWTTQGLLDAIMMFFVAILLVMGATYWLFMTLITFVLNRLKQHSSYYYQPHHFLSVSGMIYRIRSNATSLASIAILSTGFMLALGSTIAIYGGIEDTIKLQHVRDYEIGSFDLDYYLDESEEAILGKKAVLETAVEKLAKMPEVKDLSLTESIFIKLKLVEGTNELINLSNDERLSKDRMFMGMIMTVEDYNRLNGTNHQIASGEILVNDLNHLLDDKESLVLEGVTYQVKTNPDPIHTNVVIDMIQIVVPNREQLLSLGKVFNQSRSTLEPGSFSIAFDVTENSNELKEKISQIFPEGHYQIKNITKSRQDIYQFNGGFLFLGMMIGAVLLIGTVLMIYYKQITEGYDDKANFQVMKQVGLPEEMIKTTIKQQTFWLFALPIIVAVIHGLVASKIIFRLLGLFGIYKLSQFFIPYLIVITVFVGIYYIVYRVTSNVYYQIVNEE